MTPTIIPPGGTFPASNGTSRSFLRNQNTEKHSSTVDRGEQPTETNDCLAAVATILRQYLESASTSEDNAISAIPDSEITNSPGPPNRKRAHRPSLDEATGLTGQIKRQKQSHGQDSECAVSKMRGKVPEDPEEDAESADEDAGSENVDEDANAESADEDAGSENVDEDANAESEDEDEDADTGNEDDGNERVDVQNKQHEGETNGDSEIQETGSVQDKQHIECDSECGLKQSKSNADKVAARRVVNKIRSGLEEMGQQTLIKDFEIWSKTGKESRHALCIRIEKTLRKQGNRAMNGGRELRWMHWYLSSCFALARMELVTDDAPGQTELVTDDAPSQTEIVTGDAPGQTELVTGNAPVVKRTLDRWRSAAHMTNMIVEGLRDSWGARAELVYHALAGTVPEALLRLII